MVQDAFLQLARAGTADSLREPRTYLHKIVRNLLIDRARLLRNRTVHVLVPEILPADPQSDPSYDLEVRRLTERYRAVVDSLPQKMQRVFILSRVQELNYEQIAEELGISVRTVRWHLAEAIVRIDKALSDDD